MKDKTIQLLFCVAPIIAIIGFSTALHIKAKGMGKKEPDVFDEMEKIAKAGRGIYTNEYFTAKSLSSTNWSTNMLSMTSSYAIKFADPLYANNVTFGSGDPYQVVVNTQTGRVTYKGDIDKAAVLFWDAVVYSFPHIRERIIEEYKKSVETNSQEDK